MCRFAAVASFLFICSGHASAQIRLQPVVSGLDSPTFVTSALDGTNRLFFLEMPGTVRVLAPGAASPTLFLDISSKVLSGGERGLLGLAFDPQFRTNRRFYVDYTRQPDGATVIAAYQVSQGDPNRADSAETVLLTIPQPYSNHNGGMLAFGPDGYLYIGMGDGGSGNDPENRAQNPRELLGKILRIDVHSGGSAAYASPPTNPFASNGQGRSEIYALGLRNPWRFSFDRATGTLYAGDVGQGEVEEIDTIRLGGNYGWRVMEGTRCTGLGPQQCNDPAFIPPIAEYRHDGTRCSVTGGYVYRGNQGSFPSGTYIFGDYCSGEIFELGGSGPELLLDTDLQISSFGEDEQGEMYVASLNSGTVYHILSATTANPLTLYFPMLSSVPTGGAGRDLFTGFALTNPGDRPASATFTAYDTDGILISGSDDTQLLFDSEYNVSFGPTKLAQLTGRK
jgi:glucose/arabinose dehydrogenase